MQAMLAAFLQINTKNSAIQSVQADWIGRTYPLLFTINLPKEEEIIDDLREITMMEYCEEWHPDAPTYYLLFQMYSGFGSTSCLLLGLCRQVRIFIQRCF